MGYGQKLFHYTTYNIAIEHILDTGKLRLSPLQQVNDPRESLNWMYSLYMGEEFSIDFQLYERINSELNTALKESIKILCMSQSILPPHNKHHHEEFYSGFARSRMWAQYAGNHTGICLGFDKTHLMQALNEEIGNRGDLHFGEVRYTNSQSSDLDGFAFRYDEYLEFGAEKVVEEKFNRLKQVYFFTKNEDWSSEQEFRYLIREKETGYRTFDFKNALQDIYLGHLFPRAYIPLIERFAKKYKTNVYSISWHNGYPTALPKFFNN